MSASMLAEKPARSGWFRDSDFERTLAQLEDSRPASLWRDALRRFWAARSARVSVRFLAVLALLSFFAPLLPLPSPAALRLQVSPQPPDLLVLGDRGFRADYWPLGPLDRALVAVRRSVFGKFQTGPWLGTDAKGRDTLSRILWGSRTSLLVALCAGLTSLVIGGLWGAVAGLSGARVDNLMMRIVDVLQSVPTIFVVIFLLSFLDGPRADLSQPRLLSREQVFFLVIGAVTWLSMARVVRGQVLSLRTSAFVEAARLQGASTSRIVLRHVLPNVLSVAVVYVTLILPSVILYEAFLSFLGLGVEPPKVSWGLLAADGSEAISPLVTYWWLILFPTLAIGATLLALVVIGDALRDALDVRGPAEPRSAAAR
jgi:oligopeptide transport system permease protein